MDLLDLLDELLAADRAQPADDRVRMERIARAADRDAKWYPCGLHERTRGDEDHLADCWHHTCPSCGEHVANAFLMGLNHYGADSRMCPSIKLRLNHLTSDIRNGRKPDERDLTVIDLGYLIGPDGSQIHPDGYVDPCLPLYLERELRAKWQT